jgi:copper chaperone CopZ
MQAKVFASVILMLAAGALGAAGADQTVTLSGVHICCGSCVDAINDTVAKVPGVKADPSQDAGTIVLTAADKPTLQKAVDALVAAGFYGKSSDAAIVVSAPSGATGDKAQVLQVTGVHLCCDQCVTKLDAVVTKVPGVTSCDAKANAEVFTVKGDFKPADVFAAMNGAGFSGKVAPATAATPGK